MKKEPEPIVDVVDARILAMFGDKITTDHISPAGADQADDGRRPGHYLSEHQAASARRTSITSTARGAATMQVMHGAGTFANIRIKNFMLKGADGNIPEGGPATKHWPDGEQMPIYNAAT